MKREKERTGVILFFKFAQPVLPHYERIAGSQSVEYPAIRSLSLRRPRIMTLGDPYLLYRSLQLKRARDLFAKICKDATSEIEKHDKQRGERPTVGIDGKHNPP